MQEERSFIVTVVAIFLYNAFNLFLQNSSYLWKPYFQNNGNYTKLKKALGGLNIFWWLRMGNLLVGRHEWYSGLDLADIAQILL